MRTRIVLAVTALMALPACDQLGMFGGGGGTNEVNASANQAGGSKDPSVQAADAGVTSSRSLQPAAATGGKPTDGGASVNQAMLIGRWGDNGDCTKDIQIFADGTFRSFTGGEGNWTLAGDQLTISGTNGATTLQLTSVSANQLIVRNPDGSVGTSQRC